ncbi:MAG: YkgJ family cysteine cluster protein [Gammaproteobacteria bacterium]|nr:YkgJ family cysteine cluster protein [Gammaproteobacteria bacterium]
MECRPGCGVCCIAPSISSAIPDMAAGKAAGVRCVQLDDEYMCRLFGLPSRPDVCIRFSAQTEWCGTSREEALQRLSELERATTV